MTGDDQYFLGYRREEQQRLREQARRLANDSLWLLDQLQLPAGARVLEIGCGPQGCLDLLSERVGPSGHVVGIETSEDAVALARKFVVERGLPNVEVLHGDARTTGLLKDSFDLVAARLVLVNVPHPEQIVAEAAGLARPGGLVAFHEIDWAAIMCDPPLPEWNAMFDLFVTYTTKNGMDLFIGRKLPRMLRAAGLVDVRVNPIVHAHPYGDPRRGLLLDFIDNLRERILAQNLINESELARIKERVRHHLEDQETLVWIGPYVQAWGRKAD